MLIDPEKFGVFEVRGTTQGCEFIGVFIRVLFPDCDG